MVKNLTTMQETRVRSLGWEELLEKEMATNSSILAWRIPQTEEPGGLQSMGLKRVRGLRGYICIIMTDSWSYKQKSTHCKAIILQLKINKMKIRKKEKKDWPTPNRRKFCVKIIFGLQIHFSIKSDSFNLLLSHDGWQDFQTKFVNQDWVFLFIYKTQEPRPGVRPAVYMNTRMC